MHELLQHSESLSFLFLYSTIFGPLCLALSAIYASTCPLSVQLASYSLTSIGLMINACTLVVNASILGVSCRGSIAQSEKRNLLPKTLYLRLVMFIVELLFTISATIVAWYPGVLHTVDAPTCPLVTTDTILKVSICMQWFFLAGMAALFLLVLDPFGCCTVGPISRLEEGFSSLRDRTEGTDGLYNAPQQRTIVQRRSLSGCAFCNCRRRRTHTGAPEPQQRTYNFLTSRLSMLACCSGMCSGKDAKVVRRVARMLSDVFTSKKYVATDIQAGLVLATAWQEEHWDAYHSHIREVSMFHLPFPALRGSKPSYRL